MVASKSAVSVLVIDCTATGAPPPIFTPPTLICFLEGMKPGPKPSYAISTGCQPERVSGLPMPGVGGGGGGGAAFEPPDGLLMLAIAQVIVSATRPTKASTSTIRPEAATCTPWRSLAISRSFSSKQRSRSYDNAMHFLCVGLHGLRYC